MVLSPASCKRTRRGLSISQLSKAEGSGPRRCARGHRCSVTSQGLILVALRAMPNPGMITAV